MEPRASLGVSADSTLREGSEDCAPRRAILAVASRFSAHHCWLFPLTLLLLCLATPAGAGEGDIPRLRTLDPGLDEVLRQGIEQSPTFRRLVELIEKSDLVIYIERNNRFNRNTVGAFQMVSARGGQRYVRITLSSSLSARERLIVLAHEFQHAAELAEALYVQDQAGMKEFYCRIGDTRQSGLDTPAAREVTRLVTEELAVATERQ